jgi:hypothetical protein
VCGSRLIEHLLNQLRTDAAPLGAGQEKDAIKA